MDTSTHQSDSKAGFLLLISLGFYEFIDNKWYTCINRQSVCFISWPQKINKCDRLRTKILKYKKNRKLMTYHFHEVITLSVSTALPYTRLDSYWVCSSLGQNIWKSKTYYKHWRDDRRLKENPKLRQWIMSMQEWDAFFNFS